MCLPASPAPQPSQGALSVEQTWKRRLPKQVLRFYKNISSLYLLHSVETPDARVDDGKVVEETAIPGLRLLKVDPVIENCWQMISRC